MFIGIDLGTTYSAASYINDEGKAEIITNRDGERTTPSVVMFEDGVVVIGSEAKANSVLAPYDVVQFVKRQMGQNTFSFEPNLGEKYSSEDISALILKRIKEDAEMSLDKTIDSAVITVPAYFNDSQRKATQDSGEIAGLNVLGIINEPTAAAIAYCYDQKDFEGNVLVYDLGGGTFDVTIMSVKDNLQKIDILSTTGNKNLGGFNFDSEIMNDVINKFEKEFQIDLYDDDEALQDLRLKSEKAKKALSTRNKTSLIVSSQGEKKKYEITREYFEQITSSLVNSTKASMEIALEDAGLTWSDISKVLLVGGSTRIPAISEMIKETTGIDPSKELNPDEAVVMGATYYAAMLYEENSSISNNINIPNKKIEVTDVNSHSLGLIALNDKGEEQNFIVLKRNSPLPAESTETFYTANDNQEYLHVQIVEGEDADLDYVTIVGSSFIPLSPRPAGSPVDFTMLYDKEGIIHVYLKDSIDGKELGEITVERTANLSQQDIDEKKDNINNLDIE